MTITRVQGKTQVGFAIASVTLDDPPIEGNWLTARVAHRSNPFGDPGSEWTTVAGPVYTGAVSEAGRMIALAREVGSGESATVTFGVLTGERCCYIVEEWSGVLSIDDSTELTVQSPGVNLGIGPLVPTADAETLLLGSFLSAVNTGVSAFQPPTGGWQFSGHEACNGNGPSIVAHYRIESSPSGGYSDSVTCNESGSPRQWGAILFAMSGTPATPEPPTVEFSVDGVAFDNLLEKQVRFEFNAAGEGKFVISKGDDQANSSMIYRGAIVQCSFPEIHSGVLFEFYLENGDFEVVSGDEEGGEELTFGGPGTLSILRRAIVREVEYLDGIGYPKPGKGVWKFAEHNTEGHILNKLIREAQAAARPAHPLAGMTRTFDSDEDTDGNRWDDQDLEGFWRVKIGTNLYDAAMRLVNSGLLQIEMTPGLVLNAYRDRGVDRHNTVKFIKGVNIVDDVSKELAAQIFATHALIRYGENGDYTKATKDAGDFPYDKEVYMESEATHANTAKRMAKHAMKLREDAQDAIILRTTVPWPGESPPEEGVGAYLPGPTWSDNGQYWVGDLVTLHTGSPASIFEFNNAVKRVYAITLMADATGYLAPPILELNAPKRRKASMIAISGTLADVGTGGGGGGSGSIGASGPPSSIFLPGAPDVAQDQVEYVTDSGATQSLDWDIAAYWDVTLGDDTEFTPIGAPSPPGLARIEVALRQPATGGPFTPTWDASVIWRDTDGTETATPPSMPTAAGAVLVVTLDGRDGGTTWGGSVAATGGGGGAIELQEDGVTETATMSTLNVRHGLDADASGNLDVDESELTHDSLGGLTSGDPHTQYIAKALAAAKGDVFVATANDTPAVLAVGTDGQITKARSSATEGLAWENDDAEIVVTIGGDGAVLTTGIKTDVQMKFACTIVDWTILLDQSGSIVIDIWKDTYANYPPVVGDSITASAKPTVTTATKNTSSTLTGWTTAIAAGDTLRFNVDSITTATRAVLILKVKKV